MKVLDGFGDVFFVIKERPKVLIPAFFSLAVVGVMDFVIFGHTKVLSFSAVWLPFALTVIKWSFIFVLSAWSALLIAYDDTTSEKIFSKVFPDLFVFSVFSAFFVVWGIELYVIPGFFVLFMMMYAPTWMVLEGETRVLKSLRGNVGFVLEDAHVIHTVISLLILLILFTIPYVGEYLCAFFFVLWIPNVYVSEKERIESERADEKEVGTW